MYSYQLDCATRGSPVNTDLTFTDSTVQDIGLVMINNKIRFIVYVVTPLNLLFQSLQPSPISW